MIETVHHYSITDEKVIERIVQNDHVHINHVVLGSGEALPVHEANAHAHLIVIRGAVTLKLNDQEARAYPAGSIVSVPRGARMNVFNQGDAVLAFFIVKAPGPGYITK